ncbi:MAG: hypothetical protein KAI02_00160 [Gammaproteobacteria bacterium]|nr:hypothetical protein [Gammaproteobacteria bacterium]
MKKNYYCAGIASLLMLSTSYSFAQKAYLDPETGEFTSPPSDYNPNPQQQFQIITDPEKILTAEPVMHPNGMMSIDFQGAFQPKVYATMDDKNNINISHQAEQSE